MRFEHDHKVLDDLQHYLSTNFNGNIWGHNGPNALTWIILKIQKTKTPLEVLVYSKEKFYPIPYQEFKKIFDPKHKKEVLDKTKDSYGIHLWNWMNKRAKKVSFDPDSAFRFLAIKYCPVTAKNHYS